MKKCLLFFGLICLLLLVGCDLLLDPLTTTTTSTSIPTTSTTSTTTTTVPVTYLRPDTLTYTYFSDGVINNQYTDTYHYPTPTTGRYDSNDRLYTTSTKHDKLLYTRDQRGRITRIEYYDATITPNLLLNYNTRTYLDNDFNLSQILYYNSDGELLRYNSYSYDEDGHLIGNASCIDGNYVPSYEYSYFYDDDGVLIRQVYTDYLGSNDYNSKAYYVLTTVDANDRISRQEYFHDEAFTDLYVDHIYIRDEYGNLITESHEYFYDTYTSKSVYEYTYEEY